MVTVCKKFYRKPYTSSQGTMTETTTEGTDASIEAIMPISTEEGITHCNQFHTDLVIYGW